MTSIGHLYDPEDQPGSGGSGDYVPPGNYEVAITYCEMKETSAGDGRYLYLELTVLNGQYQGKCLVDRLNLENPNDKAVIIARATLASIRQATGVHNPQTAEELFNIPMVATVKDEEYDGAPQTRIKRYTPLQTTAQVGPVQAPQTAQQAPPGHMPRGQNPNTAPQRPGPNRPPAAEGQSRPPLRPPQGGGVQRPPRPAGQPPYQH